MGSWWGIISGLLTVIGFALLLVKNTESLTVTLSDVPEGTRVSTSGVATPEIIARLNGVLSGARVAPVGEAAEVAREAAGTVEADTKICPRCAETVKAQAVACRFCGYEFEQDSLTKPAS